MIKAITNKIAFLLILSLITINVFYLGGLEFSKSNYCIIFWIIFLIITSAATILKIVKITTGRFSKFKNIIIVSITTISVFSLSILILNNIILPLNFSQWVNFTIMYRNKSDKNKSINVQILDYGAFGYGGYRTVLITRVSPLFNHISEVDTLAIDKNIWIYVNESGDIKFP